MKWAKILLAIFCFIQRQNVFGQPYCCQNATLYLNVSYICENTEPPLISCDQRPSRILDSLYTIQNDTEGEYLDTYEGIVRNPYFCIGQLGLEGTVAIYCPTQVQNFTEMQAEYEQFLSSEQILLYFSATVRILDFISILCTAFMAAALLPAGEKEDKFLFHLCVSLGSAHAFYFYNFVSSYGILPEFCLVILYLTFFCMLSTFMWFFLIIYYLWKKYKFDSNPSVVVQHYLIIGYGVPTLLIGLGNIHTYVREMVNNFNYELRCSTFHKILEEFYVQPFVIATVTLNIFLWYTLRRHMRNTISITPENEVLQLKINKLLTLTGRLLIVLGLPWLLLFLCDFTNELTLFRYEFLLYISSFLDIATSGDGIFVSMVLVSSHPRLKTLVLQTVRCIIRWFQKNLFKRSQQFSVNPENDHIGMETSPEAREC